MGTGFSQRDALEEEARRCLREQLAADAKRKKDTLKVLLLGAQQSGKSTFYRNVVIMDSVTNGLMEREHADAYLRASQRVVQKHTWRLLQLVARRMQTVDGVTIDLVRLCQSLEATQYFVASAKDLEAMLSLLRSQHFADAFEQTQLDPATATEMINAQHFIDKAPAILTEDFDMPSVSDVLQMYLPTTGYKTREIKIHETKAIQLLEVGGKRSERGKWLRVSQDVDCILFALDVADCVRSSVLWADSSVHCRWHEAMTLLKEMLDARCFECDPFWTVVLTKCDWLFANYAADEKLEVARIRDCDERPPPMTASECLRYLKRRLPRLCSDAEKRQNVRVVAVNSILPQMEGIFDLATVQQFDASDTVQTLVSKESRRRDDLLIGVLKEWTVELPIWERLDSSDLRRLIEAFAFGLLERVPKRDPRMDSVKEPWQVLTDAVRSSRNREPFLEIDSFVPRM